jgi:hypothetical protein
MNGGKNMEQKYELRALKASDFFLVTRILSKIGVKECKACLESVEIKQAIKNMMDNQEDGEIADSDVASIGMTVVFDIASVVLERMENCEKDIYNLLSRLSGLKEAEIADLPMADFGEMVIAVIKHEGFRDFFTAVIKQFK